MVDWKKAGALMILSVFLTSFVVLSGCIFTDPVDKEGPGFASSESGESVPFYSQMWFVWLIVSVLLWAILYITILVLMAIVFKKNLDGGKKLKKTFGWLSLILAFVFGSSVFWNDSIRAYAAGVITAAPFWIITVGWIGLAIVGIVLIGYAIGLFGGVKGSWKKAFGKDKPPKTPEEVEEVKEAVDESKPLLEEIKAQVSKVKGVLSKFFKLLRELKDAGKDELSADEFEKIKGTFKTGYKKLLEELKTLKDRLKELEDKVKVINSNKLTAAFEKLKSKIDSAEENINTSIGFAKKMYKWSKQQLNGQKDLAEAKKEGDSEAIAEAKDKIKKAKDAGQKTGEVAEQKAAQAQDAVGSAEEKLTELIPVAEDVEGEIKALTVINESVLEYAKLVLSSCAAITVEKSGAIGYEDESSGVRVFWKSKNADLNSIQVLIEKEGNYDTNLKKEVTSAIEKIEVKINSVQKDKWFGKNNEDLRSSVLSSLIKLRAAME